MNVDELVAIDVHVHVEISPDGHISVITQLPQLAAELLDTRR
jgi:hypothetical protein